MAKSAIKNFTNVTMTDVQLASAYYPILIDLAQHKHCLTYGELVERAKSEYPDRLVLQMAIAVSTGRRLDIVRAFTEERGYPDLSSLVISKGTESVASGLLGTLTRSLPGRQCSPLTGRMFLRTSMGSSRLRREL